MKEGTSPSPTFVESRPKRDSCWRAVVLFGRNVASYKFALARSLIELSAAQREIVTLEELAMPFSRHITEHLKRAPRQATSPSSAFLDACRDFNAGKLTAEQLQEITMKRGFNNVIDAFHVVGGGEVPKRFFLDERKKSGSIRLTDEMFHLREQPSTVSLDAEAEARWRLVETAWNLGVPAKLLEVRSDPETKELFVEGSAFRRISIVGARAALNGYQKGRCFYCSQAVSILTKAESLADIDHFFPKCLDQVSEFDDVNLDGVWNLVIACQACNRGEGGKFDRIPVIRFLERLHRRNSYLIDSHHPLRETLINQTGSTEKARAQFLQFMDQRSINLIPGRWEPAPDQIERLEA